MEVRIEKLVYGGDGLAHHEGQTVFVPLVLPGELVQHRRRGARKRNSFAGGWNASWSLRRSALPLPARTLDAAAAASTSTCRTKRNFATKPKFCAKRWDASVASSGTGRLRRMPRLRSAIAIARSGRLRPNQEGAPGRSGNRLFRSGQHAAVRRGRMLDSFAAPRGNISRSCARLSSQSKIFPAIDEIEAFADSADEKILLNLSAERLDRFAGIDCGRPARSHPECGIDSDSGSPRR